jgi:hypothetical protein
MLPCHDDIPSENRKPALFPSSRPIDEWEIESSQRVGSSKVRHLSSPNLVHPLLNSLSDTDLMTARVGLATSQNFVEWAFLDLRMQGARVYWPGILR